MVECSLWLKPAGKAYDNLADLITNLSRKYSSPVFRPHVTLLDKLIGSEQDLLSRASALAAVVSPLRMHYAKIGYLDEYFKCLFIRVKKTHNLMQGHMRAREIFEWQSEAEYMPHLSLVYGNLPSMTKKEIVSDLRRNLRPIGFDVKTVQLVVTEGQPKEWTLMKELRLKG